MIPVSDHRSWSRACPCCPLTLIQVGFFPQRLPSSWTSGCGGSHDILFSLSLFFFKVVVETCPFELGIVNGIVARTRGQKYTLWASMEPPCERNDTPTPSILEK